jgi:hypothetical protein
MSTLFRSAKSVRSIFAATVLLALLSGCGGGGGGGSGSATTGPVTAPAPSPTAILLNPVSLETYSALDARIRAQFSIDVDASTVNQNTVILQQGTVKVPVTVTLTGREVDIKPSAPLDMTRPYTIVLTTGIKGSTGIPMAKETRFNFLTVPPAIDVSVVELAPTTGPVAAAVADVNGDGRADIVTTRSGTGLVNSLLVYLQRADGTLAPAMPFKMTSTYCIPTSITIGDLNKDGKNDIVVGTLSDGPDRADDPCGLQVFLQDASGNLGAPMLLPTLNAFRVKLADLNRDGMLDIVGAGYNTGSISVFKQGAGGVFAASNYQVTTGTDDFALGDINHDGMIDIVQMRGLDRGLQFAVLAQKTDGTFAAAKYYDLPPPFPATGGVLGNLTVADINEDGLADVVVTVTGNTPFARVIPFYQNAQGELAAGAPIASFELPGAVRQADMNLDGKKDLVVVNRGWQNVTVYYAQPRNEGLIGWLYKVPFTSDSPDGLAIGDIDGDGDPDIVMATSNGLVLMKVKPTTPAAPGG